MRCKMRSLLASVGLLSTLVVLSTAQSYVPVKFSASVYHVCTVRGRPSSVALTLESLKEHNFDFTVNVITRDGTAKRGSDYDAAEVITKTFVRRHRSVTISIPIVTGGDVVELPEYFTVELQLPMETKQKGVYAVSPATARIEIIDVPIGTFSPQNYTVREGEATSLTIVLDRLSVQDTIFNVATMSLTATTFDDYFRHNYNITVPARTLGAFTTVVTQRNTKIEAEEYFKAIVRPLVKCDLDNEEDTAYITITDCTVGVNFHSAMYMVGEGDGSVTVTVEASKEHHDFDFVIKMVARDGTAETLSDFHEQEVKVTFPAGKTTVEASIGINDDEVAESLETFYLVLEIPEKDTANGVVAIAPNTTEIKIIDNDASVLVSWQSDSNEEVSYNAKEGVNLCNFEGSWTQHCDYL